MAILYMINLSMCLFYILYCFVVEGILKYVVYMIILNNNY